MIEVWVQVQKDSETAENSPKEIASCVINGVSYQARSARGAVESLARDLVEVGIPDDAVEVLFLPTPGLLLAQVVSRSLFLRYTRLYSEFEAKHRHHRPDKKLCYRFESFENDLAPFTYSESSRGQLRRGKYVDLSERLAAD